jgi:hypothetical protein
VPQAIETARICCSERNVSRVSFRRAVKSPAATTAVPPPVTGGRKSAIVIATSKRDRIIRRKEATDDDTEASPEIKAFFRAHDAAALMPARPGIEGASSRPVRKIVVLDG